LEVGDIVEINGITQGTVEEVGLRITKIREYNQRLHYLANGTITEVTNYNRDKMRAIVLITVPYESNQDLVSKALEEVCENVKNRFEDTLVEQPEVVGVTSIDQTGVQFTITATTNPSEYWNLEREMRKECVKILHRNHIQFAYPRSVIYNQEHTNELQTK
jgi:small-conductance mechanosensitive channel